MASETFYRDTWAEISLDAIKENIKQLRKVLLPNQQIFAVVKANAYGHGHVQVSNAALEEGVDGLAVSLLDEALDLRTAGITAPILVMGWVRPRDVQVAIDYDITLTVFQKNWVLQVMEQGFRGSMSVHLKVDTGMGRIGVRSEKELEELLALLQSTPMKIAGIFTHFATADETNTAYLHMQQSRFESMLNVCKQYVDYPIVIHAANSAASMRYPAEMHHAVRFGISMYGLYPSLEVKGENPIELQPSFSLHSRLIHVKQVSEGEKVSYGATYTTKSDEWIGTIPIGYADGWIRKLQGFSVLVEGKRMPIVGRICMDQCMIRLDKQYPLGTKVTLIGQQGDEELSADDVAKQLQTINYEVPCLISYRVPRIYKENGKIVGIKNSVLSQFNV